MKVKVVEIKNQKVKMIYLTKQDKSNIRNMHPDCNVYCVYENDDIMDDVVKVIKKFKNECKNKKEE